MFRPCFHSQRQILRLTANQRWMGQLGVMWEAGFVVWVLIQTTKVYYVFQFHFKITVWPPTLIQNQLKYFLKWLCESYSRSLEALETADCQQQLVSRSQSVNRNVWEEKGQQCGRRPGLSLCALNTSHKTGLTLKATRNWTRGPKCGFECDFLSHVGFPMKATL